MKIVILSADGSVRAWHEPWQQAIGLETEAYAGFEVVRVRCRLEIGKPLPEDAAPTVIRAAGAA